MGGKPRRWKALGSDFIEALRKYAELEHGSRHTVALTTFRLVAERYMVEVSPLKARAMQRTNASEFKKLFEFFDNPLAPLEEIQPIHIRKYLDWRKDSPIAGNREIALFSHVFNKAREWGATDRPNPCAGIRKFREGGRDTYVDDRMFQAVRKLREICAKHRRCSATEVWR